MYFTGDMIVPSDKDYKETKLVKQGKASLNPEFKSLANWINNEYKAKVLNIYYDLITVAYKRRPRLNIIFEDQEDELRFRDGFLGNFHSDKQAAIATKFAKLVKEGSDQRVFLGGIFAGILRPKYDVRNLLVIFSSFRPIAKDEANEAIPATEIDNLKAEINDPTIWEISRFGSRVTFFFLTQEQADAARSNSYIDQLADKYFNLLTRFDEFGYFDRQRFSISVDSKENFDKNYDSNWYYYYK
jgi:hypothetical protein